MKKKWTRDEIARTYAKFARIPISEAVTCVDALTDAIDHGGRSVEKWSSILANWGWDPAWASADDSIKSQMKWYGRLMRAFGIKSTLKYTCAECGCKVEVKV